MPMFFCPCRGRGAQVDAYVFLSYEDYFFLYLILEGFHQRAFARARYARDHRHDAER